MKGLVVRGLHAVTGTPLAPRHGLADRLRGGVASAAPQTPPDTSPCSSQDLRDGVIQALLTDLYQLTSFSKTTVQVGRAINQLAGEFAATRPFMLAALFAPGDLPELLPDIAGYERPDQVDGWLGTCWIAEAAWKALHSTLSDPRYVTGDLELLLPLAARLRFLALSEPLRWRCVCPSPWVYGSKDDADEPATRVFGGSSWNALVGQCREARRVWLGYLNEYQSHVYLSQDPYTLEADLRAVLFRGSGGAPLCTSVQDLGEAASLTAEDKALVREVTGQHLLPRFDVLRTAALALHDDRHGWRLARMAVGVFVVLAGLAAVILTALLHVGTAAWVGAGCYLLIGAGTGVFGPQWAAPWLLRFPAAATIGLIALISLSSGGWIAAPPGGWLAVLALAAASLGYLVLEARNHGVAGWALALRPLGVGVIGAVHALMVSLIGLVWVAGAFVPNRRALTTLWHSPSYAHTGMALALAAAWCLTVGVFSQILWDDRPITAPLAHLTWRAK
jgi:hypothetical protein